MTAGEEEEVTTAVGVAVDGFERGTVVGAAVVGVIEMFVVLGRCGPMGTTVGEGVVVVEEEEEEVVEEEEEEIGGEEENEEVEIGDEIEIGKRLLFS